jgi:hypothetical protein
MPREHAQPVGWLRLTAVAWAAVVLIVCAHALLRPHRNSVYPIFAEAGRDWSAGGELYEEDMAPFRYSPAVAAFFAPFALLPDGPGGALWRLLNAAVLLAGLAWWTRDAPSPGWRAVVFLLVLPLAAGNLHNGQSNALVLGLLLTATAAVARQRWNLAAVAVAVAVLFKLYPVALGLLFAAAYPRRFALRFALALTVGLALPLILQRPSYALGQYAEWAHHLANDHRQNLTPDLWYRDARSLLMTAGVGVSERAWVLIELAAAALCAAAAVRAGSLAHSARLPFALGCFWMTLFGPATEPATYLLLAPTAAWAVVDVWEARRGSVLRGFVLAAHGLFAASVVVMWFPVGRLPWVQELRPAAAVLLLIAVLASELPRLLAGLAAALRAGRM